jgi:hypothetical protein
MSQRDWNEGVGALAGISPDTHGPGAAGPNAVLSNSLGRQSHDPYAAYVFGRSSDVPVLSDERGVRKSDPAIFKLTLDRLGLLAESCVFADDIEENVVTAHLLGMMVIHLILTSRRPPHGYASCSDCAGTNAPPDTGGFSVPEAASWAMSDRRSCHADCYGYPS